MKLSFIEPRIELKPYIQSIWVFEGAVGLPSSEISLAAPNGSAKLIFNSENSLITTVLGRHHQSEEQNLYFVGMRDVPVVLSSTSKKTCFIGIEFRPSGAHPILGFPMAELTNRRLNADDLSGIWSRSCTETIRNLEGIPAKIDFIQGRLLRSLRHGQSQNAIVQCCVDYLKLTNGAASIRDLELKTGYERRHLENLFSSNVGVSPKTLSRIFRFQWFYKKWARVPSFEHLKEDVHEYFYDEAHFNKEFKRMTGFSPKHFFLKVPNQFGRQLSLPQ
ncbi:MAG: DUF6597 domain-containing transcriptional factor [Spirochaetia bacterium]|jgi:AraC-like DNA-binding protein